MDIKVIGLGGIGSCLTPTLLRFLQHRDPTSTVTFVDGDSYEERNRDRQSFDEYGNKAEVTCTRMQKEFPLLCLRSVPEFVADDNVSSLIYNEDTVFACVDNHATRKLISEWAEKLSDIAIISAGNSFTTGTIQVFARQAKNSLTLPLTNEFHPEIKNPEDFHPLHGGCMALGPAEPQLVITNNLAAAIMLAVFYDLLQGPLEYDEILFDITSGNCRAVRRRQ